MKRTIAILCVMTLLVLTLSSVALATNTRTSGLYTYEIKGNGTLTITRFNWNANDGDVFIPNMIDGYTVTAIGDEAFKCNTMRRSGSDWDRENNFDTVAVTIPDSIKSIGKKAFWNATLSAINLPDDLQSIGYGAFVGNPDIQFKLSNKHPHFAVIDGALYSKASKELLAYTHIDEVYDQYSNHTYTVPEGILSIADYAFYRDIEAESADSYKNEYFIEYENIHLPSTLKKIGNYAFAGFSFDSGSSNMFPASLESIGESAFEGANGLIKDGIIIPNSVDYIGRSAFKDSNLLYDYSDSGSIVISEGCILTVVEEDTFRNCADSIRVKATDIRRVAPYAFYNAGNVSWEHIGSIEEWGEYAFAREYTISVLSDDYVYGDESKNTRYSSVLSLVGLSNNIDFAEAEAYINSLPPEQQSIAWYQLEMGTFVLPDTAVPFSRRFTEIPAGFELDITLPDTIKSISSFAYRRKVTDYRLPNSLENIAVDAFPQGSTFVVDSGSYAELWCSENGFGYTIEGEEDDLSWLN